MLISAVLVVLLGCYPAPLVDGSNAASQSARIDASHPAAKVIAADRPGSPQAGNAHVAISRP
jgi:hypothetical protein